MSLDYTLPPLPCCTCKAPYQTMTDLQDHHFRWHERDLYGQPVAVWLARDVTQEAPARDALCACGCVYDSHSILPGDAPEHPCLVCECRTFGRARDVTRGELDAPVPIPTVPLQPSATNARCGCGHSAWQHPHPTQACLVEGCGCPCLGIPVPPTALEMFWGRCAHEHLPYDAVDARLLLDTLGVPPDAPAEPYSAGVAEAVQRHRDKQGGVA